MNHYLITISVQVEKESDYFLFEPRKIYNERFQIKFIAETHRNGLLQLSKTFYASYSDNDLSGDEKIFMERIIMQFKSNRSAAEFSSMYTSPEPGDTIEIKIDEKAKEIFDLLKRYSPKLIDDLL